MPTRTEQQEAERAALEDYSRAASERNRSAMENYDLAPYEGSGYDSISANIPIWSWVDGSAAREAERRRAHEEERNRQMWERLARTAPSVAELTPEYSIEGTTDEYGNLLSGPSRLEGMSPSEQQAALGQIGRAQSALGELMRGGMTAADRQALTASRLAEGARLRGANEAAIQQAGARGMGGGGAELAARLAGSQAYANANAMQDASILGQSQNRALQAMQGYGALGQAYGAIGGQMYGQEMQRRSALDAHNQQNVDWRRGRETRNTAWTNQGADKRSEAYQQDFENRLRTTAGAAGHNPVAAGAEDRARQDQSSQAAASGIGALLSEIL